MKNHEAFDEELGQQHLAIALPRLKPRSNKIFATITYALASILLSTTGAAAQTNFPLTASNHNLPFLSQIKKIDNCRICRQFVDLSFLIKGSPQMTISKPDNSMVGFHFVSPKLQRLIFYWDLLNKNNSDRDYAYSALLAQNVREEEIRDLVRREVDNTFRHTIILLNTFLILLALFPTAAALGVWILQSRLVHKITLAEQEIESIKYDTISQIKNIVTEIQAILKTLQEESNIADEKIEQLKNEATLIQYKDSMPGDSQPLLMATDYAKQGDKFFMEGRLMDAIKVYEQALKVHPEMADTWNNRGVVLTRLQNYEEAIASYDRALQIRPEYPDAWNNRGVCLLELQEYQEAIVSYEQAIKVKPDYADAWNNRGVALSKLQNYQEAVKSYNQALAIKNDYSDAWNNRGVSLTKLGIYGEAIACYDNATKLRPDFLSAWYNKARCYALQEKVEEAIESLKKAMSLNSNYCRQAAPKESDFDGIRDTEEFKQLMHG